MVDDNHYRRGFARTCNLGARDAIGDVLVFLNNDTIPQRGWLEPLVAKASEGIAGSLLRYPDGRIQHAGVRVGYEGEIVTAWNILDDMPSGEVDAVTGACLAIERDRFFELGGFDEGFVNGYEDVDLCLRHRALGGKCWFVAESSVIHLESQSGSARWTHVAQNVRRLHERWNGKLDGIDRPAHAR